MVYTLTFSISRNGEQAIGDKKDFTNIEEAIALYQSKKDSEAEKEGRITLVSRAMVVDAEGIMQFKDSTKLP